MRLLTQNFRVRYSFMIFSILGALIFLFILLYWFDILADSKWPAIISGLLTGFVVALFQTFLSLVELRKIDKYDALRIKNILPRRDDREYYEHLISTAKEKVYVQGVTAQRFLDHFANDVSSREGAKVLLAALGRGVEVRILIASKLVLTEKDQQKTELAKPILKDLSKRFPEKFKYAYFEHPPAHSIVVIDGESIVGPVFSEFNSEFTPAIHLENKSEFVQPYLKYFENEWAKWSNDKKTQQS